MVTGGYDAGWFRAAPADRKIVACIASKVNRKVAIPPDALFCRQCHQIEIMTYVARTLAPLDKLAERREHIAEV